MEETSVVSMEFVLAALIALAALLVILWYTTITRFKGAERKIFALTQENKELQRLLEKTGSVAQNAASQTEPPQTAAIGESAGAGVRYPVVPVGGRQPVVLGTRAMVAVKADESAAAGGISPDVAAVIMAAVAAYGYSPTAIRSIRSNVRQNKNWVMAGRLAGMK